MVDTLRKGGQCFVLECRIRDKNERFAWCRIKVTSQYDAMGKPKKAIGIISDIDDEHQLLDRLREKAERDALTGLYDKSAVCSLTEKYLDSCPSNQMNALLMLDVDNFKIINDLNGHLFGDTVLSDVAALLKREFRTDDLIGRIGGDEFAIFMKNVPTKQFIQKKAEQIVALFSEMYADKKKKISISCSIGSADMPGCGHTFQELYKCADTALYYAKSLGKNCCAAYVPHMGLPVYHEMHTHAGAEGDSQIPLLKTVDPLA